MLYSTSCPLFEIEPSKIRLERVPAAAMKMLQPQMSHATWRPALRPRSFLVMHADTMIGLLHLDSCVINMGVYTSHLGLSKDPSERGKELRQYANLSVCVGNQPIAWYWNLGKLVALLATTMGDEWKRKWGDELKGIITTSLYGKGSQYNRIYKLLGYTKGNGHEHITTAEYHQMIWWLKMRGHGEAKARSDHRMANIQRYARLSKTEITTFHGKVRGIYYHAAIDPKERAQVIQNWYERWGLPRYVKRKDTPAPYQSGLDLKDTERQEPVGTLTLPL